MNKVESCGLHSRDSGYGEVNKTMDSGFHTKRSPIIPTCHKPTRCYNYYNEVPLTNNLIYTCKNGGKKLLEECYSQSHSIPFTYPFLHIPRLSPNPTITSLTPSSLSHSFLPIAAAWWLSSCRCFFPLQENQNVRMHCHKRRILRPGKKPGHLMSRTELCGTPWQLFKAHNTGTVPVKPGRMRFLLITVV